jgi:putative ABC transport system permease protein
MSWRRRSGRRLPAVGVALGSAAGVLALAAAAVAPTLAAAGDAATASELARTGVDAAGLRITAQGPIAADDVAAIGALLDEQLGAATGPGGQTIQVDPVVVSHGDTSVRVRPVADSRIFDALELRDGDPAAGFVVPDVLADELGIAPGDRVTARRGDAATEVVVGGVARPLDPELAPAGLADLAAAHAAEPDAGSRPLDLLFGSPGAALDLAGELGASRTVTWSQPAPDVTDLEEARTVRARMARVATAAGDPRTELGAAITDTNGTRPQAEVGMGPLVRDADAAVAALAGPARAVGIAGQAVALAVAAAAALFAARAREIELKLAAVRGRSPLRQGLTAAVRAIPALLAGAVVGWATALAVVAAVAPGRSLPAATAVSAAWSVSLALVPALAVIAAVTAGVVASAVRVGRRRRRRNLARAPWEAVVLGLAAIAYVQLRLSGGLSSVDGAPSLHPLVLAFPVLLLTGLVGLAVRAGRRALPALRHVGGEAPAARFLALRRLAAASGPGLLLAGATALALGLVVYTAALASSLSTAVDGKAVLQLGADAVAPATAMGAADAAGTEVLRGRGRAGPGDRSVDVLLVDADTFGASAYWDRGLADGADLDRLLAALDGADERLPAIVAGGTAEDLVVVDLPGMRIPIDVVERVESFPGRSPARPLVVASRTSAAAFAPGTEDAGAEVAGRWRAEVWTSGTDAVERLVAAGADVEQVRTSAEAAARPRLVAVTWALGALQAFAVLATALALVGVLLFVSSRQRATQVSYALARRMGLSVGSHRVALGTEVVALLGIALAVATALGLLASALVAGALDPIPDLPPRPRMAVPAPALAALAGTLVVAGLCGAALLQRGADRANVAEVLRGG